MERARRRHSLDPSRSARPPSGRLAAPPRPLVPMMARTHPAATSIGRSTAKRDAAMSDNYLVISALGKDRPGIVNTLSKAVLDSGCNISHSRMAVLGGEFAVILLIHGTDAAVHAMQQQLPLLEEQLQLTLIAKTTAPRRGEQHWLPYRVAVVAMARPGIVHRITDFFAAQKINIEELETAAYAAPHTGTPMFSLTMTVAVTAGTAEARQRAGVKGVSG